MAYEMETNKKASENLKELLDGDYVDTLHCPDGKTLVTRTDVEFKKRETPPLVTE